MRSATVHVDWPDGVHIAVVKETARFTASTPGGQWESLSADGRVLGESPTPASRPPAPHGASAARRPGHGARQEAAPGLRVASSLPASFSGQVTQVTVEPAGWVQLALTTPVVVDIGTAAELTAKYRDISPYFRAPPCTMGM